LKTNCIQKIQKKWTPDKTLGCGMLNTAIDNITDFLQFQQFQQFSAVSTVDCEKKSANQQSVL